MIIMNNGVEVRAWIVPYEKSSLGESYGYVQYSSGANVLIESVKDDENLVAITGPDGHSFVVKASQIITAIQKCV